MLKELKIEECDTLHSARCPVVIQRIWSPPFTPESWAEIIRVG